MHSYVGTEVFGLWKWLGASVNGSIVIVLCVLYDVFYISRAILLHGIGGMNMNVCMYVCIMENDRVDHFPALALTFTWEWWPSGSRDLLKIHKPWLTTPLFQQVGQSFHLAAQEHSFSRKHHVQLQNTEILSIKSHYMHSVIRVVTMVLHHLNRMNREDGLVLSRSWKPLIQTLR